MDFDKLKVGDLVLMVDDCANDNYNGHIFKVVDTTGYEEYHGDFDIGAEVVTMGNKEREISKSDAIILLCDALQILYGVSI